jgi:hypothetical protein
MNTLLRLCVFAVLTGVLLAGAVIIHPEWCDGTGVDFWNLPALLSNLEAANRRDAELEKMTKEAVGQIEAKYQVVRNVVDGRLTLREAIARFRQIQRQDSASHEFWRSAPPDLAAAHEQTAQQILLWCEVELQDAEPERFNEVMERLRAELLAIVEG